MEVAATNLDALNLDEAPKSIVLRSLRRRFWHALHSESGERALFLYQATLGDWRELISEERKSREKDAEVTKRRSALKGLLTRSASKDLENPIRRESKIDPCTRLLQTFMNPSEPFTFDDFKTPGDLFGEEVDKISLRPPPRRREKKSARQTLQFWTKRSHHEAHADQQEIVLDANIDRRMTTPLHEALRIGHVELVKLMLRNRDTDPSIRNGMGRTCLHMAAGGILEIQHQHSANDAGKQRNLGILKPEPILPDQSGPDDDSIDKRRRSVRRVSRLFHNSSSKKLVEVSESTEIRAPPLSRKQHDYIELRRVEIVTLLLRWRYPTDGNGSDGGGEASSVNAVDDRGRTALHYAAELGRLAISQAILDNFGMLTIVDDQNRTPCDLASSSNHAELADQLEARSLLYMDPYGMDEILLASVLRSDPHAKTGLVPPFGWFRTIGMTRVQEIREHRVTAVLKNMKKILIAKAERQQDQGAGSVEESADKDAPGCENDDETDALVEETIKSSDESTTEVDLNPSVSATEMHESHDSRIPGANGEQLENVFIPADEAVLSREDSNSTLGTLDISQLAADGEADATKVFDTKKFDKLHKAHAECFLQAHGWQVKEALVAFLEDPVDAFGTAGIPLPELVTETRPQEQDVNNVCSICFESYEPKSKFWRTLDSCSHRFCIECLGDYIVNCAKTREMGVLITCPDQNCGVPLTPLETMNLAPSPDTYGALIDTSNQNFIAGATDIKFCPHPGCDGIVKISLPDRVKTFGGDIELMSTIGAVCSAVRPKVFKSPVTYEGVCDQTYMDCHKLSPPPRSHRFCFSCGEQGIHWPVSCELLREWKTTIREHEKDVTGDDGEEDGDYNDIAQKLWLKTNTRPCPKCKAPIEKSEGCNHMSCLNPHCKYEFCWVCRKSWRSHSSSTGGFFRCNRWVDQKNHTFYDTPPEGDAKVAAASPTNEDLSDPRTMEGTYGTSMHQSRVALKRSREMARFLHHYERWNAHADSANLEQELGISVCTRLKPVVKAAIAYNGNPTFNFGGKGLSFVYAAFFELAECRSMLQYSYAFSFFRYNISQCRSRHSRAALKRVLNEKTAFEQIQAEVETLTEQMSDVVARSRLRATQSQITYLTSTASAKRAEFSSVMASIGLQERKEAAAIARAAEFGDSNEEDRKKPAVDLSEIAGRATFDDESNDGLTPYNSDDNDEELEDAIRASLEQLTVPGTAAVPDAYDGDDGEFQLQDWACSVCTFVNSGGSMCEMCGNRRE